MTKCVVRRLQQTIDHRHGQIDEFEPNRAAGVEAVLACHRAFHDTDLTQAGGNRCAMAKSGEARKLLFGTHLRQESQVNELPCRIFTRHGSSVCSGAPQGGCINPTCSRPSCVGSILCMGRLMGFGPCISHIGEALIERRWYQLTWPWVLLGVLLVPLNTVVANALWDAAGRESVIGLYAAASLGTAPACMWIGALVARSQVGRWMLVMVTGLLVVIMVAIAALFYMGGLENDAMVGCMQVIAADGQTVRADPVLCDSLFDGTFERMRARNYGIMRLFWLGLLVVPFMLRGRFQPEDRRNTPTVGFEAAGWVSVILGGVVPAWMLSAGVLTGASSIEVAVSVGTYAVVPISLGVLAVVIGRRRRMGEESDLGARAHV